LPFASSAPSNLHAIMNKPNRRAVPDTDTDPTHLTMATLKESITQLHELVKSNDTTLLACYRRSWHQLQAERGFKPGEMNKILPPKTADIIHTMATSGLPPATMKHVRNLTHSTSCWSLTFCDLYGIFGESIRSQRLLVNLRELRLRCEDFNDAWPVLCEVQTERQTKQRRAPGVKSDAEWQPVDVDICIRRLPATPISTFVASEDKPGARQSGREKAKTLETTDKTPVQNSPAVSQSALPPSASPSVERPRRAPPADFGDITDFGDIFLSERPAKRRRLGDSLSSIEPGWNNENLYNNELTTLTADFDSGDDDDALPPADLENVSQAPQLLKATSSSAQADSTTKAATYNSNGHDSDLHDRETAAVSDASGSTKDIVGMENVTVPETTLAPPVTSDMNTGVRRKTMPQTPPHITTTKLVVEPGPEPRIAASSNAHEIPDTLDVMSLQAAAHALTDRTSQDISSALATLRADKWLNNYAIQQVLQVFNLADNCHIVDPTWVSVSKPNKRVGRRYREQAYLAADDRIKLIIVPLNHGNTHWTLGIINVKTGSVEVYDPLNSPNYTIAAKEALAAFATTITCKMPLSFSFPNEAARQRNTIDCGIYILVHAIYRMYDLPLLGDVHGEIWRYAFECSISTANTKPPKWSPIQEQDTIPKEGRTLRDLLQAARRRLEVVMPTLRARISKLRHLSASCRDVQRLIEAIMPAHERDTKRSDYQNAQEWCTQVPQMPQLPNTEAMLKTMQEHRDHYHKDAQQAQALDAADRGILALHGELCDQLEEASQEKEALATELQRFSELASGAES